MTTKTFDLQTSLQKDKLAEDISAKWLTWQNSRMTWEERYRRTLEYLYSVNTDTIYGAASAPWSANVHIPKLTQLRDVLITYELESLFSVTDYFEFQGFTKDANTLSNRTIIRDFLKDQLDKGNFRATIEKAVTDYIDAGNSFGMPVWTTERVKRAGGYEEIHWEGSKATRINPLDIVFDPTASDFKDTPKIIRTIMSLGELALLAENDDTMKQAFNRAIKNRQLYMSAKNNGDTIKDESLSIAGFGSMGAYMESDVVELLTFHGTLFDVTNKELHSNKKITIMDRSVILKEEDMEDIAGYNYIVRAGYRDRKDILWAMSPLENLIGMQARIDFLENKRSDCYDYVVNPIKVITGNIDMPDALGPGDDIHKDVDSDIRYLAPDTSVLTADNLIGLYENKMEQFTGAPQEVLGFRTPGEKTLGEVNQLFTAATRIYQRQIRKFEVEYLEPMLNAMLEQELKHRAGQKITVKYWDSENEFYAFKEISVDDIKAAGRIVVRGSQTAQNKAQIITALQMMGQNPLFMDEAVRNNISTAELGQVFMYASGLDSFPELYQKDRRLYEITDQQKLVEQLSQQVDQVKAQGMADAEMASQEAAYRDITAQRQGILNG